MIVEREFKRGHQPPLFVSPSPYKEREIKGERLLWIEPPRPFQYNFFFPSSPPSVTSLKMEGGRPFPLYF
jgi:hypothetical protein